MLIKRKMLIDEAFGQIGRGILERMKLQIILPGVEGFARDKLGETDERARLPDDEVVLSA